MAAIVPSRMDQQFGPVLAGHFDFTLLFEQAIFEILPAALVILAIPWYVKKLAGGRQLVRPGLLLWGKLCLGALLCAMYVVRIVLWQRSAFSSTYSLASTIVSLFGALCAFFVIYVGHVCYLQPSTFLSLFFSVTMLCDIATTRSMFLRDMRAVGAIEIVILLIKFGLIVFEEIPKRQYFCADYLRVTVNAEANSGFWNRSFFVWLNPLLLNGFRRDFSIKDLPELEPESRPLVCSSGFLSTGVERILDGIRQGGDARNIASSLIGATILVFGGLAVSRAYFSRLGSRVQTGLKAILILAIYDKMQKLGAEDLVKAAAITLMTADVAKVQQMASLVHTSWSALLELAIGVYALYTFVGYACFLIFIPAFISAVATFFNAKKMSRASTAWNAKIEKRVAATSKTLDQLKNIKAAGLSYSLAQYLQDMRKDEIDTSMSDRYARVAMFGIHALNATMTPVIVFAGARFWTRTSPPMSSPDVFATFALILIISGPLNLLISQVTFFSGGYACVTRIRQYLLLEEVEDACSHIGPAGMANDTAENQNCTPAPKQCGVEVQNLTLLSKASVPLWQNVNVRIPVGSLAMLHGQVGTGKSLFMRTLLGEIRPAAGSILIPSAEVVSYSGQIPWLRNLTIKGNIIGYNAFVEPLYSEVIYACALDRDIAELPDGDETLVGTDGNNLSGGQKQRVGLARSLYFEASIVLLDDSFSSLDTETTCTIFYRLFGPKGFLRRRGRTIIMTTNKPDLLKAADVVLEITEGGHVVAENGLRDLSFVKDTAKSEIGESAERTKESCTTHPEKGASANVTNANSSNKQSRRHGDFALYSYFLRSAGMGLVISWICSVAFTATLGKMPQIFTQIWLDTDPKNNTYFIGFAVISFGVIICTCGTAIQYFMRIIPKSSTELHGRLLRSAMGATLSHISHTDSGVILNRFSQDISLVSQMLPIVFMQAVYMLFSVLVDVGVIASGAKYASPIIILLIIVLYVVQYFYLRTSRQLRLLELELTSPFFSLFKETSAGIEHIRAFQWQEKMMADFSALVDCALRPFYSLLSVQQWLEIVLDSTTCCAATILVSIATIMSNSTSDTALGLALLNLISFGTTASFLIRVWVMMESCLGGLSRIKAFCEETPQEDEGQNKIPVAENWPVNGRVDFKSVSAAYLSPSGAEIQAIDNADIAIEHGQKVGIIGRTGSGKSSMILVLLQLIKCSGGHILVDGRDITTVPRRVLRARITTLTQEGTEVPGSLRFNLYPFEGPQPSENLMITTLNRVGLWDYIVSMGGENLDGLMSDMHFSPGQKQIFFLARAMLHQATRATNIIIMDEASSSMDYEVDQQMQQLVEEAFAGCTVIIIAHRTHTLKNVDVILRLESGKVTQMVREEFVDEGLTETS
ncbi:hypothetical protein NLG97_g4685 [Lecanicillium saksenae]|uniref:Uncharacterized protein n=1 Tax=Lecanicillium saksenae TaxID=468837 RepID=A0ACC1QX50_9HYPO|nr:hypothetical protein NLG97_g4685 [Lecanicillium saksenae]